MTALGPRRLAVREDLIARHGMRPLEELAEAVEIANRRWAHHAGRLQVWWDERVRLWCVGFSRLVVAWGVPSPPALWGELWFRCVLATSPTSARAAALEGLSARARARALGARS